MPRKLCTGDDAIRLGEQVNECSNIACAHRGGSIEADVADDDVLAGSKVAVARRVDNDNAAGQALAHIVVGVTLQLQGDPWAQPGAHALPCMACQPHMDGRPRKARTAEALGHLQTGMSLSSMHLTSEVYCISNTVMPICTAFKLAKALKDVSQ